MPFLVKPYLETHHTTCLTYHCCLSYLPTAQSMENSACSSEHCSAIWHLPSFSAFLSTSSARDSKKSSFPTLRFLYEIPLSKTQSKECIQRLLQRAGEIFFSTSLAPGTQHLTPEPDDCHARKTREHHEKDKRRCWCTGCSGRLVQPFPPIVSLGTCRLNCKRKLLKDPSSILTCYIAIVLHLHQWC